MNYQKEGVVFQFLKHPFPKTLWKDAEGNEDVICPPPQKPYLNGTDDIPPQHPSFAIRKLIKDHLPKDIHQEGSFPGNKNVSLLHKCKEKIADLQNTLSKQLVQHICLLTPSAFQSTPDFYSESKTIPVKDKTITLPADSGYYNGDVFEFLKGSYPCGFDIVAFRVSYDLDGDRSTMAK